MRDYFESEMRLLNEAAHEFAEAYPEQAGLLNMGDISDRDPYIERLLEGMAFLTAQIRRKIDDDIPEISESLLQQLWPTILRPMPSATIMEFLPRPGQLQQTKVLPAGVEVLSQPVGEELVPCRFRTVTPVKLQPLRIQSVTVDEPSSGGSVIKLNFHTESAVSVADLDLANLSLYLHADTGLALELYMLFTHQVRDVAVRLPQRPHDIPFRLGRRSILPLNLATNETLTPNVGESFHGFHLLQEYFCFKEKYQFVGVHGLEQMEWPQGTTEFELEIYVDGQLPSEHHLSRETFKLCCAPAVNLFPYDAEPVRVNHRAFEYPIVAEVRARHGIQIYTVDQVTGIDPESGQRFSYEPVRNFSLDDAGARFFQVTLRSDGTDKLNAYMSVGGEAPQGNESLSCKVTCTNGHYPRRYLTERMVSIAGEECPSYVSAHNIIRPSALLNPTGERDRRWLLIAGLAANYDSIASAPALRRVLSLYEWSGSRQNRLRIEGISEVAMKPLDWIRKGAMVRGIDMAITVNEGKYRSLADIYLFGTVLHHFFSSYAQVNTFVRTRIVCHPSNKEFVWEPRQGANLPI